MKFVIIGILLMYLLSSCSENEGSLPKEKTDTYSDNIITIQGITQTKEYTAQIAIPKQGRPDKVLYYFHGTSGNVDSWKNDVTLLNLPEKDKITIISISYGPLWFITVDGNTDSPIIPIKQFAEVLIPEIESKIYTPVTERIVWGISMGAYNATLLSLYYPELFDSVIINSPSILLESPYASEKELKKYIRKMEIKYLPLKDKILSFLGKDNPIKSHLYSMINNQKYRFPSESSWDSNDIIQVAQNVRKSQTHYFISCGTKDQYSFYEGSAILEKVLNKKGYKVTFQKIRNGNHLSKDYLAIKYFILNEIGEITNEQN